MIEAIPSKNRNTVKTSVSETAPDKGHASSTTPAMTPTTAEQSDHQNPGAWRMRKVVIKPTIPLAKSSQPIRISTANVARGGIAIAANPRSSRTIPSKRNSRQCSLSEAATADCIRSKSGLATTAP